jgi:hypothetical protein
METLAEQLIATYLTRGGKVFVCPSYSIKNDWSCPDFVALDFDKHEIIVVEVTTAYDIDALLAKVEDRDKQWFAPLRAQLNADHIAESWDTRFLGFVRRDRLDKALRTVSAHDVKFVAIEDTTFSWDYWKRREGGLPR